MQHNSKKHDESESTDEIIDLPVEQFWLLHMVGVSSGAWLYLCIVLETLHGLTSEYPLIVSCEKLTEVTNTEFLVSEGTPCREPRWGNNW